MYKRYPGFNSFTDTDLSNQLFFGREKLSQTLLFSILSENLTVLYSKSGYGKTSILQAGVFKLLREQTYYPLYLRLNKNDGNLQDLIKSALSENIHKDFEILVKQEQVSLEQFLAETEIWSVDNKLATPVLVFDQLEEIFSVDYSDSDRRDFIGQISDLLLKAKEGRLRIKIVISLREEYLGNLETLVDKIPSLYSNRFRLEPLTPDTASEAITKPGLIEIDDIVFASPTLSFAPDALDEIVKFLSLRLIEKTWIETNEIDPVQLQIICRTLEERSIQLKANHKIKEHQITKKDLAGFAGLRGMLSAFKDRSTWKILADRKLTKTWGTTFKSITVPGKIQKVLSFATPPSLQYVESFLLSERDLDSKITHLINIEQNDKIFEFVFDDNSTWICDATTMHELFPNFADTTMSPDESFWIPLKLPLVGDNENGVFLKNVHVYLKKEVYGGVVIAADKVEEKLMAQGEGLFSLNRDFCLAPLDPTITKQPFLLFLHGTISNTHITFSSLQDSDTWRYIHKTYGPNVLTYQYRSLTKSPLRNVVELVKALPDLVNIHIISHAGGGLLGEILCRYSRNGSNSIAGFSNENLQLLEKYDRADDIACIEELNILFATKKIIVRKFIRIACPAAGTSLAARRLDTILNVFFNFLSEHSGPIADLSKELIVEALSTKDNISVLPGLEAQSPESPFIKILNDMADMELPSSGLAIISGNTNLGGTREALFAIIGRWFHGQRNDLVVNTDSMYLGAKRTGNIQYFFDQGPEVDHFKYFMNVSTRHSIALALKTSDGDEIPGFKSVKQYDIPASDRGLVGIEYGELYTSPNLPTGNKPIIVLVPGILASNLSRKNNKLWLEYTSSISGGLFELGDITDPSITATSIMKSAYSSIVDRFSYTYDVIVYPFDWRKQLSACANEFNEVVISLMKHNQPIKIIGHSMGGVLVRDFIINHPQSWARLNTSAGFKLLYLGAPLLGSFRILTLLFGNDPIINALNLLDRKHTKKELIELFANFPGILSLLPLTTEDNNDFANPDTWKKMAEASGENYWPVPTHTQLEIFKTYRDNIISKSSSIDYSNIIYIAGKDKFTPSGYYNHMIPPRTELVFLCTSEGDQTVTWESGIPKQLVDSKSVYYVDVTHGALADESDIFDGIEEILEKGYTSMLSSSRPSTSRESDMFRMPEVYNFNFTERGVGNAIFGRAKPTIAAVSQIPVSVSISNGDLAYTSFPVFAGHFKNDGILSAEKAIDILLNGSLSSRLHLDLYPGEIGTNTVILPTYKQGDFPGAVIVGLGEPGFLTSHQLAKTVEQGVMKYLLNINNQPTTKKDVGISSLIIGCGYGGLSLENSLKAIIDGVNNANKKIKIVNRAGLKLVRHIEFIELLEDRALGGLYSLSKIESKENSIYNIKIANKKIKKLFGFRKRLPMNIGEEWWNRITVKHKTVIIGTEEVSSLVFSTSTRRASEEEKELFTNTMLIDLFLERVSTQNRWTSTSAKALFELMIPNEFKDQLKKKGSINWILDEHTAAYPWELLQENINDTKPLCIGSGMIRQLSTRDYASNIQRVATELALVIGDPMLNGFVSQLEGARDEALQVQDLLNQYEFPNITLVNKNASQLILNLFSNDFKIIHLAGHGVFNPNEPGKSGMVIGNDVYLTTFDIKQLSTIPELVFVNCCHLGKHETVSNKYFRDRFRLAANIGTQLIQAGVKVVVAAGWAVNDKAAQDFAKIFYSNMFAGYNFGDSVTAARSFLYETYPSNNTWGAYQCYGDPFYKLINRTAEKKDNIPDYAIEEEALVDLNNLKNSLDTRNITSDNALARLYLISKAVSIAEINTGSVLELEASILFELGEYDLAVDKYEILRQQENATFSVASLEKLCNLRSKKCVQDFRCNKEKEKLPQIMNDLISELNQLVKINRTSERLSLLGSAHKRLGLISDKEKKEAAYRKSVEYYREAYAVSKKSYSLNNWIMMQCILDLIHPNDAVFDPEKHLKLSEQIKNNKSQLRVSYRNMDYWELLEDVTYDLSLVMLSQDTISTEKWNDLFRNITNIWNGAGSKGKKLAEIENMEIISDMLSLAEDERAQELKSQFDKLRERLLILI
ncbi:CHAT domain-containing protein [Flavitalea sp.]|nr:CHAT domain-containing protein [Flavitalea sp.]